MSQTSQFESFYDVKHAFFIKWIIFKIFQKFFVKNSKFWFFTKMFVRTFLLFEWNIELFADKPIKPNETGPEKSITAPTNGARQNASNIWTIPKIFVYLLTWNTIFTRLEPRWETRLETRLETRFKFWVGFGCVTEISWLTILVIFWESWQGSSLSIVVLKIIAAECVIQALKLNSITNFWHAVDHVFTRVCPCMFMDVHEYAHMAHDFVVTLSVLRQVNTRILDSMITLGSFTLSPFLTCLKINKQDTFYTRCYT